MNKKFFIVQAEPIILETCREFLRESKLERNKDYCTFTDPRKLDEFITSDEPQLLFIDTLGGELTKVAILIEKLRLVNPQLVVVYLDHVPVFGDPLGFDEFVNFFRPGWPEEIKKAIKDFDLGKLRHDPVQYREKMRAYV